MPDIIRAKPRFYTLPITVGQGIGPIPAGTTGRASVTIQDLPFILKRITWAYLTLNGLAPAPIGLIPDGFYYFSFKTDNHVYSLEPVALNAAFGSGFGFQWLDLPSPVELRPKTTFQGELTTGLARTIPTTLQFVLAGMEPDQAPLPPAQQVP
jgi:hypothetical protein